MEETVVSKVSRCEQVQRRLPALSIHPAHLLVLPLSLSHPTQSTKTKTGVLTGFSYRYSLPSKLSLSFQWRPSCQELPLLPLQLLLILPDFRDPFPLLSTRPGRISLSGSKVHACPKEAFNLHKLLQLPLGTRTPTVFSNFVHFRNPACFDYSNLNKEIKNYSFLIFGFTQFMALVVIVGCLCLMISLASLCVCVLNTMVLLAQAFILAFNHYCR